MFFYFSYKLSLKHADAFLKTSAYFFICNSIFFKSLFFSMISQVAVIFDNTDSKA